MYGAVRALGDAAWQGQAPAADALDLAGVVKRDAHHVKPLSVRIKARVVLSAVAPCLV